MAPSFNASCLFSCVPGLSSFIWCPTGLGIKALSSWKSSPARKDIFYSCLANEKEILVVTEPCPTGPKSHYTHKGNVDRPLSDLGAWINELCDCSNPSSDFEQIQ